MSQERISGLEQSRMMAGLWTWKTLRHQVPFCSKGLEKALHSASNVFVFLQI